jgi:MFS family permease
MNSFIRVWLGQLVSLTGSALTSFALGVWIYNTTHSAALFSILAVFTIVPAVVIAPFAGVIADRWSRRAVMMTADSASAVLSVILIALLTTGRLAFWHICAIACISAALTAVHRTGYSASVALLVDDSQMARANGLMQFANAISQLVAPLVAGFLIGVVGISGVVMMDLATFVVGIVTLLNVRFPPLPSGTDGKQGRRAFKQDLLEGWVYLRSAKDLLRMNILTAAVNSVLSSAGVMLAPLVLSFATPKELGLVMTFAGLGSLAGGLLLASWGGPVVLIRGVWTCAAATGLSVVLVGLRPSIVLVCAGVCASLACLGLVNGCAQTVLQRSVPNQLQGRVIAFVSMLTRIAAPVGYMVAGPVIDFVLQPALQRQGAWAVAAHAIVGAGPGRGIAAYFAIVGLATLAMAIVSAARLEKGLNSIRRPSRAPSQQASAANVGA